MTDQHLAGDLLTAGRAALRRGAWQQARAMFERALAEAPSPEAYEGLAWAAWWLYDVDVVFDARERAYRGYQGAGKHAAAARAAMWLGSDHLDLRGAEAVANGWLRRARRLLDGLDPTPEHGWLALHEAFYAILDAHDTVGGRQLAATATQLGRRFDDLDLEAIGMASEGLALVKEGRVEEGMGLLDEAVAMALAGEGTEMFTVPWTCCFMIYACESVHDHERAAQWCRQVQEFSERHSMDYMWGVCRAHHAAVLVLQGEWDEAERQLRDAARTLERTRPPWVVEATVRLGELRRRQGRYGEAESLFRLVDPHPLAIVGLAEIALDRGDPGRARDLAERLLRNAPSENRTARAGALQLLGRAHAALGDHAAAAAALAELDSIAVVIGTAPLRATAAACAATLAAAADDHQTARRRFEDAVELAERARLPYEAARARIGLASALAALGRADEAREQAQRAQEELARLGATLEAAWAAGIRTTTAGSGRPQLTAREIQVLGLVARGLSDREIAAALTLSQHTVHRHVSNIFTKLGCASRATAVARALAAGVLEQPTE